jgi:formylglycine-generating enzyme required for sulfatase activity
MILSLPRLAALLLPLCGACGAPREPDHPATVAVAAPLSMAADAHMLAIRKGQSIAGSTREERDAAYDAYRATAGRDTARERKWFESEDDRHVVKSDAFRIDLMPVTQAAYAEWVSTGLAAVPAIDEATWTSQGFSQDFERQVARFVWRDGRPPIGREDHPVVLVTYAEAAHYCAWRGELRGEPRRLPTAAEFERAARGDEGLAYPWGNVYEPDKLDSAVKGPEDTMPVGSFTAGASPFGMLDAAGNVFEWTSTPFNTGEMTVKGSAWDDHAGVGRGASRHGRPVGIRHVIVGFRCAADPAR